MVSMKAYFKEKVNDIGWAGQEKGIIRDFKSCGEIEVAYVEEENLNISSDAR